MMSKRALLLATCLGLCACAGKDAAKVTAGSASSSSSGAEEMKVAAQCPVADGRHESSEYDTTGDGKPDVRKVFLRVGDDALARLVLVCREHDVNGDGLKDVARFYSDDGEPVREVADVDFDGKADATVYYDAGEVLRREADTDHDGKVDEKVFFENGVALRTERDVAGRSTSDKWQPDHWEYIENGKLVRIGTDEDGDGKVDRWDRDADVKKAPPVNPNGLSG